MGRLYLRFIVGVAISLSFDRFSILTRVSEIRFLDFLSDFFPTSFIFKV